MRRSERPAFLKWRTAALAAVLCFCASLAQAAAVGLWYGQDDEQVKGVLLQYLTLYRADGTYTAEFRHYEYCVLVGQWIEQGTWKREGNRMVAVTVESNGEDLDPPRVHEYVVESESFTLLNYRHLGTGILFRERRVNVDFEFPACEPTS